MGGAAGAADPATGVLRELQDRLAERLETLVAWVLGDAGNRLHAELPDCDLALTKLPHGYKLTAIFMGAPPGADAPAQGPIERGRRVLKYGPLLDLQEFAIHLARRGIGGGPTYDDGPLDWSPMPHDGSARMAVPGGELRVNPLVRPASNGVSAPDCPCALMFEDGERVYPLALDTAVTLRQTGIELWTVQEARRPLQILLNGECVYLRSTDVPGVLGYHAVARHTLITIAWVDGEIGLFYVDGHQFARLARLTLNDLRHGEAPDVEALLRARARRGAANEGPTVFADEPPVAGPHADAADAAAADEPPGRPEPPSHSSRATEPTCTPMAPWHRELCERHLRSLHAALRGRGARKARQLIALLLLSLARCSVDLHGSRTEVHAALAEMMACTLSGGNRNIRDCLDLLAQLSPIFDKDGHSYAILFAQLHDPRSELVQRLAAMEASTPGPAAEPALQKLPPAPGPDAPSPTTATGPNAPPPSPATEHPRTAAEQPPARPQPDVPTSAPYGDNAEAQLYRTLGAPEPMAPPSPTPASTFSTSPNAPIAAFVKDGAPLFDDPDDPLDLELESLDSPSRMYLASRQKAPGLNNDTGKRQDSS